MSVGFGGRAHKAWLLHYLDFKRSGSRAVLDVVCAVACNGMHNVGVATWWLCAVCILNGLKPEAELALRKTWGLLLSSESPPACRFCPGLRELTYGDTSVGQGRMPPIVSPVQLLWSGDRCLELQDCDVYIYIYMYKLNFLEWKASRQLSATLHVKR